MGYMYPDELRLTFMSANLVGGMMQRLDKLRKYAFSSVAVFGSNNNSSISGVWSGEVRTWLLSRARTCRLITHLTSGRSWTPSPKIARKRLRITSGSRDQTAQDANSATERSSSKTSVFLVSIFYSFLLPSLSTNGKENDTKMTIFYIDYGPPE